MAVRDRSLRLDGARADVLRRVAVCPAKKIAMKRSRIVLLATLAVAAIGFAVCIKNSLEAEYAA